MALHHPVPIRFWIEPDASADAIDALHQDDAAGHVEQSGKGLHEQTLEQAAKGDQQGGDAGEVSA